MRNFAFRKFTIGAVSTVADLKEDEVLFQPAAAQECKRRRATESNTEWNWHDNCNSCPGFEIPQP